MPVLQVSFVKLLSLVRTLWLTLELGGDYGNLFRYDKVRPAMSELKQAEMRILVVDDDRDFSSKSRPSFDAV